MIQEFSKIIIVLGFLLMVFGAFLTFLGRIPFFGKLPGDILIKRENFTFYAPIATSLLVSIILSILLIMVSVFFRK